MIKKNLMVLLVLLVALPVVGDWNEEKAKIDYLLTEIGRVDGVFVRNDKEHTPREAVNHLKMKLERAMDSWFAPDKEDWTVQMFIEKLASKSSLSGKPYYIRLNSGESIASKDWLNQKLKQLHDRN